jgi:hypothetical protein
MSKIELPIETQEQKRDKLFAEWKKVAIEKAVACINKGDVDFSIDLITSEMWTNLQLALNMQQNDEIPKRRTISERKDFTSRLMALYNFRSNEDGSKLEVERFISKLAEEVYKDPFVVSAEAQLAMEKYWNATCLEDTVRNNNLEPMYCEVLGGVVSSAPRANLPWEDSIHKMMDGKAGTAIINNLHLKKRSILAAFAGYAGAGLLATGTAAAAMFGFGETKKAEDVKPQKVAVLTNAEAEENTPLEEKFLRGSYVADSVAKSPEKPKVKRVQVAVAGYSSTGFDFTTNFANLRQNPTFTSNYTKMETPDFNAEFAKKIEEITAGISQDGYFIFKKDELYFTKNMKYLAIDILVAILKQDPKLNTGIIFDKEGKLIIGSEVRTFLANVDKFHKEDIIKLAKANKDGKVSFKNLLKMLTKKGDFKNGSNILQSFLNSINVYI